MAGCLGSAPSTSTTSTFEPCEWQAPIASRSVNLEQGQSSKLGGQDGKSVEFQWQGDPANLKSLNVTLSWVQTGKSPPRLDGELPDGAAHGFEREGPSPLSLVPPDASTVFKDTPALKVRVFAPKEGFAGAPAYVILEDTLVLIEVRSTFSC